MNGLGRGVCVIDAEMTGGSPADGELIEVAAVRWDPARLAADGETFRTLLRPTQPIPPIVRRMTGISDRDVRDAPTPAEGLPAFWSFVGDDVVVGHAVAGDLAFLHVAAAPLGLGPLGAVALDTAVLAQAVLGDALPRPRLKNVAAALDLPPVKAHRALADAQVTADVLSALLVRRPDLAGDLDALVLVCGAAGPLPRAWRDRAAAMPGGPGVWWVADPAGRVLHLGAAEDVRAGYAAFAEGPTDARTFDLLRRAPALGATPTRHVVEAQVVEARLRVAHRVRWDRRGVGPGVDVWLRVRRQGGRLALGLAGRLPKGADGTLFLGPGPGAPGMDDAVGAANRRVRDAGGEDGAGEPALADGPTAIGGWLATLDLPAPVAALVAADAAWRRLLGHPGERTLDADGVPLTVDGGRLALDPAVAAAVPPTPLDPPPPDPGLDPDAPPGAPIPRELAAELAPLAPLLDRA